MKQLAQFLCFDRLQKATIWSLFGLFVIMILSAFLIL